MHPVVSGKLAYPCQCSCTDADHLSAEFKAGVGSASDILRELAAEESFRSAERANRIIQIARAIDDAKMACAV